MNADDKKRFVELDGLKGLFCIVIFCYPYYTRVCGSDLNTSPSLVPILFLKYGNLAVEFFFCISGFLSALSYRNRDLNMLDYMKRRLKIYPQIVIAVFLCTLITCLDRFLFHTNTINEELTIQGLLRSLLMISIPTEKKNPLSGQTWFYQVLVLCFIIYFFVRKLKAYYLPMNTFLAILGYTLIITKSSFPLHSLAVGRGLLSFFTGAILYEVVRTDFLTKKIYTWCLLILSIGTMYLLVQFDQTYIGSRFAVFGMFAAPAFILSVIRINFLRFIFQTLPMRFLGSISLAFYLLHQNIIDAVKLFNARYKMHLIFASNKVFAVILLICLVCSVIFRILTTPKPTTKI